MHVIKISTKSRTEMIDITDDVRKAVNEMGLDDGIVTVYSPHTTAGITINEGADPSVQRDIIKTLNDLFPVSQDYEHSEGNSDAHIQSSLMGNSAQVIVENGKLQLGRWQAIYFCEFDGPRKREVWVKA